MSNIQTFDFGRQRVRTVFDGDTPFWVAKDVCEALGYTWDRNLVAKVPAEWKGVKPIHTPGGEQEIACLSEQGLYFFLSRSDKPAAVPFQKWIAGDVIPAIRKTGNYSIAKDMAGGFIVPRTFSEALRLAADQAEQIDTLLPKAIIHDRIADARGCKTVKEVAAILDIGANTLFSVLRDKGIFFREAGINLPIREHIEAGRFIVIEEPYESGGDIHAYSKIMVTPKGELWLAKIINEAA